MAESKKYPIDNVVAPIQKFIQQEKSEDSYLESALYLR
jgi:hypothetical protein